MNSGSRRDTVLAALLGLVVGLAVVAPWVREGYLLLLDWVSGPNQTLTPGVYGLSGSALDAMPFRIITQISRDLVGSAATAWLVILAYFPLAAAGASVAAGGSRWRRFAAAFFMVCNPVVVDRVRVGHVAFLLGIALLPWLFAALLEARRRRKWFAVRPRSGTPWRSRSAPTLPGWGRFLSVRWPLRRGPRGVTSCGQRKLCWPRGSSTATRWSSG